MCKAMASPTLLPSLASLLETREATCAWPALHSLEAGAAQYLSVCCAGRSQAASRRWTGKAGKAVCTQRGCGVREEWKTKKVGRPL